MDILIKNKLDEQNDEQNDVITSILEEDLRIFSEQIRKVDMTIRDVNGPKGGRDLECLVQVKMRSQGSFFAKAIGYEATRTLRETLEKIVKQMAKEKATTTMREFDQARRSKLKRRVLVGGF